MQTTDEGALLSTRLAHGFLYRRGLCNATAEAARTGSMGGGGGGGGSTDDTWEEQGGGGGPCGYLGRGLASAEAGVVAGSRRRARLLALVHVEDTEGGPAGRLWDGAGACLGPWAAGEATLPAACPYSRNATVVYGEIPLPLELP